MIVLTVDFEMVSRAHAHDKNKQYYFRFFFRDSCDIGFLAQFNAKFTSQVVSFPEHISCMS